MHIITFISTIHKENGKCNADELCRVIEKIHPEVIFLEALEDTYSKYQQMQFSSYGVFHSKLEINAIQKYNYINTFKYVPVLEIGMSDVFDKKYNTISNDVRFQNMVDDFNSRASVEGFQFLNSAESIQLQDEMRTFEYGLLNGTEVNKAFNDYIEEYENSMLQNIYSYCRNNQFESAIFMCGVGHRKSIIAKVEKFNAQEEINLNWEILEFPVVYSDM